MQDAGCTHLELALHAGDLLLQAGGGGLRVPGASCSLLRLRRRPLRLGHRLQGRKSWDSGSEVHSQPMQRNSLTLKWHPTCVRAVTRHCHHLMATAAANIEDQDSTNRVLILAFAISSSHCMARQHSTAQHSKAQHAPVTYWRPCHTAQSLAIGKLSG